MDTYGEHNQGFVAARAMRGGNTNYDCAWHEKVKPLSASIMFYLVDLNDACTEDLTEDRYRPNRPAATQLH